MGMLEDFEVGGDNVAEIERGAWENLFVSMERSFYNIADLSATSVSKLFDDAGTPEMNWVSKNLEKFATMAGDARDSEGLARETDPEMMDKFAELLGTTVPYTVAALGGAAAGATVGLPGVGAALVSFSIMREESYRDAINTGATENEAQIEGYIVGGVNALIEMAQVGGILRQTKTGSVLLKNIGQAARNKTWSAVSKNGMKLGGSMIHNALQEAFEEALQGTVSEGVPKLLRGVEIEGGAKGYLGRRVREAGAGALIGGLFSGMGQLGTVAAAQGKKYLPSRGEVEADGNIDQIQSEEVDEAGITPPDTQAEIEFSEDKQEDSDKSASQTADMIVEGAEISPTADEIIPDTETPFQSAVTKIMTAVKARALGKVRAATEAERSVELAKRTQKSKEARAAVRAEGGTYEEARIAGASELKGELPGAFFDEITEEEMSQEDWAEIEKAIWDDENLQEFEKHNAAKALNELSQGVVPTPSDLRILGNIVGKDVARGMTLDLRTKGQKIWAGFKDVINLPSTLLTTMDVSLIGRQGLFLAARHPKQWFKAWKDSYKAFIDYAGSEEGFTQMAIKESETRAGAAFGDRMGLITTTLDGDFTQLDERFLSNLAKKIPLFGKVVKASERAAVVGMNSLRTSVFDNTVRAWEGTGKTTQDYKELANIINITTGIGKVNTKKVEQVLPFLTAVFFAPKYVKSRFDVMGELGIAASEALRSGKAISPARKLLVQQAAAFVGAGMTALMLAKLLGADVEDDPRSSDFGKMKFGRTRVDVWAGNQQIARTFAQLWAGKGKSISSGELYNKNRLDIVGKFIQSKLSPAVGLGVELLSGEDFLGKPIPTFEDEGELMTYMLSKLTPLVAQDMVEGVKTEGWMGGLASGAAAFNGIGVQSFERTTQDDLTDLRDRHSRTTYQTDWDQLGPVAQNLLRANNPDIVKQEQVAKYERRNATFDATRQRDAGVAVEETLPDEVRRGMDDVQVTVGGISRTIVRNWRLNAELYQRYQDDVAERLNQILPKLMKSERYASWRPEIKQKMLDFYIRQAKASARRRIVMDANMSSFEDVRTGVEDD